MTKDETEKRIAWLEAGIDALVDSHMDVCYRVAVDDTELSWDRAIRDIVSAYRYESIVAPGEEPDGKVFIRKAKEMVTVAK